MQRPKSRLMLVSAAAVVVMLLPRQPQAGSGGETCIGCHIEQYNQGTSNPVTHPPFRDRQCSACHLESDSRRVEQQNTSQNITGELVNQELISDKQEPVYNQVLSRSHLITISDLNSTSGYRFRLLVGHHPTESFTRGLWVGLNPRELWGLPGRELRFSTGLDGEIGNHIESVTITAISDSQVLLSWQTNTPLFSWIELQNLDGIPFREPTPLTINSVPEWHPQLRSPEGIAIEACYQCHPKETLKTSHPVRLYGSNNVRIPDELPTVDGMMTCVTCHDPHGGKNQMPVRTLINTKRCITCHHTNKNSSQQHVQGLKEPL